MFGSWKINLLSGIIGFIFITLNTFSSRFILDSIVKSLAAFSVFYLFAFIVRGLLGIAFSDNVVSNSDEIERSNLQVKSEQQEMNNSEQTSENEQVNEEEIKAVSAYVKDLLKED